MSAGLCKVCIIGNLGRDPDTKYTNAGVMYLSFNVAATRKFYDSSGQLQERTVWFRVTAWRKLAETMDSLAQQGALAKGRQVYVEGSLEPREYEDPIRGKQVSLDVMADVIQLLGAKPEGVTRNKTVFPAPSAAPFSPNATSTEDDTFTFAPFPE